MPIGAWEEVEFLVVLSVTAANGITSTDVLLGAAEPPFGIIDIQYNDVSLTNFYYDVSTILDYNDTSLKMTYFDFPTETGYNDVAIRVIIEGSEQDFSNVLFPISS